MVPELTDLSPGTSLFCRISGRPATFMDRTLNSPLVAPRARPSRPAEAVALMRLFMAKDGMLDIDRRGTDTDTDTGAIHTHTHYEL